MMEVQLQWRDGSRWNTKEEEEKGTKRTEEWQRVRKEALRDEELFIMELQEKLKRRNEEEMLIKKEESKTKKEKDELLLVSSNEMEARGNEMKGMKKEEKGLSRNEREVIMRQEEELRRLRQIKEDRELADKMTTPVDSIFKPNTLSQSNKFDLSQWPYVQIRDVIDNSCDPDMLQACHREFDRRRQEYRHTIRRRKGEPKLVSYKFFTK
ncbi:hypothetical protein Pcinc_008036 [Petrolisthes cinctipes]|uniref:Uncharacterized protein n=1 Tax=Petrolisthes cinctipes TaxID=88211 RepID=A0AAE1KWB1_PETCI|nr:hypothetical protein Pcinc_008036 [Petrolisthes cinctipes]